MERPIHFSLKLAIILEITLAARLTASTEGLVHATVIHSDLCSIGALASHVASVAVAVAVLDIGCLILDVACCTTTKTALQISGR